MELELGLKIAKTSDDLTSMAEFQFVKDRTGPVFLSGEDDNMFILTVHLKGFRRDNINIKINEDGTRITVHGEKRVQQTVMIGWILHKKGVELRVFKKVFKIPDGVVLDRIKAKFNKDESILTIIMPKREKGIRGDGIEEVKEDEVGTKTGKWSCKSAMDVWSQGPTIIHKSSIRAEKFKDIFENLSATCDQQVLEFFIITARSIWHRRNKWIFEGLFQHPTQLACQSKRLLEDFKAMHDWPRTDTRSSQVMQWTPPPSGFFKINWDAAISEEKGRIGLGVVVRDHGGNIVATKKINQLGFNDSLLAEALGAFQAVLLAADLGLTYVFLKVIRPKLLTVLIQILRDGIE